MTVPSKRYVLDFRQCVIQNRWQICLRKYSENLRQLQLLEQKALPLHILYGSGVSKLGTDVGSE